MRCERREVEVLDMFVQHSCELKGESPELAGCCERGSRGS